MNYYECYMQWSSILIVCTDHVHRPSDEHRPPGDEHNSKHTPFWQWAVHWQWVTMDAIHNYFHILIVCTDHVHRPPDEHRPYDEQHMYSDSHITTPLDMQPPSSIGTSDSDHGSWAGTKCTDHLMSIGHVHRPPGEHHSEHSEHWPCWWWAQSILVMAHMLLKGGQAGWPGLLAGWA
jgi:hypothetical protein